MVGLSRSMSSYELFEGDEWEYEYDQNEREVFLVDLDMTSINKTIRSTTANRKKRIIDLPGRKDAKKARLLATAAVPQQLQGGTPAVADQREHANGNGEGEDRAQTQPSASAAPEEQLDDNTIEPYRLQVLDLHTANPVIAYRGGLYSCSWTDMIGTTMFFGDHQETPLHEPEISIPEFDLIGTSRIKLLGNQAKVTPIAQKPVSDEAANPTKPSALLLAPQDAPGKSLGTIRTSNAKANADLRKQAIFLEQLMNIKKNRGDSDNVHVVMNNKVSKAASSGKLRLTIQRREEEIDALNRKVVRGDGAALRKLQQIYTGRDLDESDDELKEHIEIEQPMRLRKRKIRVVPDEALDIDDQTRIVGTASPSPGPRSQIPNADPSNTNNNNG